MKNRIVYAFISLMVFIAYLISRYKPKFILPAAGKITSRFGEKRSSGTHNGLDIANVIGTPIYASSAGTVSRVWNDKDNGNALQITHNLGYLTGYAHLNKYSVKLGDKVKQGQKIGEMGNTGRSTGSHLHFVVKLLGQNLDPETVIT